MASYATQCHMITLQGKPYPGTPKEHQAERFRDGYKENAPKGVAGINK